MSDTVSWYNSHADQVSAEYESVSSDAVHGWLTNILPSAPATVLDVGAGSGRDAVWLSGMGYDVVATEPASTMMGVAKRLHPDAMIQWVDDALPAMPSLSKAGLSFDLILLSAVWMHVSPNDRPRAFRKLINLLKPGGVLAITLRHGPEAPGRPMFPVELDEIETLARNHGAFIEFSAGDSDQLNREDVHWTQVAVRLPDDGTGALPFLRHITLNDEKSSTYKLALLRSLCRIADGAAGFAWDKDEDHVAIPLGLVALTWLRLFKPLLAAGLPQSPTNVGYSRLGFVNDGFRKLSEVSHLDLRAGMLFSGEVAVALHNALKGAASTIEKMPATYMTFPNGDKVLPVDRVGRVKRPDRIALDEVYLSSFGQMMVPRHLWQALRRFDVWIEPALMAEWVRLMKMYAERQGRGLKDESIIQAMGWDDPSRDVGVARGEASRLIGAGDLYCVWSGTRLKSSSLDIDHCMPWSAWSCGDLWNLMPSDRVINQKKKRARLPSREILFSAKDRIVDWWHQGYECGPEALKERFWMEARASLPNIDSRNQSLEGLFDALCMQQAKLKYDQQVPEWECVL